MNTENKDDNLVDLLEQSTFGNIIATRKLAIKLINEGKLELGLYYLKKAADCGDEFSIRAYAFLKE